MPINIRATYISTGLDVTPFSVPAYNSQHFLDLYHAGFCNPEIFVTVFSNDYHHAPITGYWPVNKPIHIVSTLDKKSFKIQD